jgi:hypothetical protein
VSSIEKASAPKSAWRGLFGEDALRRLARLAGLGETERVVWLAKGEERAAVALEKVIGRAVETREGLEGIEPDALGLLVAPDLAHERGLDAALSLVRPVLEIDGVFATVTRVFVGADVPEPLKAYWDKKQPEAVRSVKATLGRLAALGFEPLTCELVEEPTLSEHDRELLSEARRGAKGEATAEAEAGIHHGVSHGLVVGRRVDPGAPPRWPRRGGGE